MRKTMLCAAVLATGITLSGCADNRPDAIDIVVASKHLQADDERANDGRGFNEVNPGAALVFDSWLPNRRYSIGAYKNSYEDLSVYVLRERDWPVGPTRIGYSFGLSTYPHNPSPAKLVVGDVAVVGGAHISYGPMHLTLAPLINDRSKGVLALRFRIPLERRR